MRKQPIDALAQTLVEQGNFGGIEWCIHKGGVPWARGQAGYLDALAGTPMPASPIYRLYSMTKPIVAMAALMMFQRMAFRLYDPVASFLPEFAAMQVLAPDGTRRPARGPILMEHLLTHKAGFSYGFLKDCPVGRRYREIGINPASVRLPELVERIAAEPLAFDPGSNWQYSVATDVLARVLEVISGKRIDVLLKKLIFDPLGMTETGYMVPKADRNRVMAMYGVAEIDDLMDFVPPPQSLSPVDVSDHYPMDDPDYTRGGLGLFSTVGDYMKFLPLLATGKTAAGERLLSRKLLAFAAQDRVPAAAQPICIGPVAFPGYGFSLLGRVMQDTGKAMSVVSKGEAGWSGAASTFYWIDPEEDMTGLVMSQYLGALLPLGDDLRSAAYMALE